MPQTVKFLLILGVLFLGVCSKAQDDDILVAEDDDADDLDAVDDEDVMDFDEADDLDDEFDPWDNTDDVQDMGDDGLPSKVFAVLHVNGDEISENIRQFIHYETSNYPSLSVADVDAEAPTLKFFATEQDKLHSTVAAAIEAGKMSEDDIEKVLPGGQLRRDVQELASFDVSDLEIDDMTGLLADHNVHRQDDDDDELYPEDEDMEFLDDDDIGDADDAEPVKPRRKKRDWRERRAKRLEKEEEKKKKQKEDFKPSYSLGTGVGLQVPSWGLVLLTLAGIGGIGFLVYMLYRVVQETKDKDQERRVKQEQREKRRRKKERKKHR